MDSARLMILEDNLPSLLGSHPTALGMHRGSLHSMRIVIKETKFMEVIETTLAQNN